MEYRRLANAYLETQELLREGWPGNMRLIRIGGGEFYSGGCHRQIKVP